MSDNSKMVLGLSMILGAMWVISAITHIGFGVVYFVVWTTITFVVVMNKVPNILTRSLMGAVVMASSMPALITGTFCGAVISMLSLVVFCIFCDLCIMVVKTLSKLGRNKR